MTSSPPFSFSSLPPLFFPSSLFSLHERQGKFFSEAIEKMENFIKLGEEENPTISNQQFSEEYSKLILLGGAAKEIFTAAAEVSTVLQNSTLGQAEALEEICAGGPKILAEPLKNLVVHSFYRLGEFSTAAALEGKPEELAAVENFHRLRKSLEGGEIQKAREWAKQFKTTDNNHPGCVDENSRLFLRRLEDFDFSLVRLHFLSLLSSRQAVEAIKFAQENFQPFFETHKEEIQKLGSRLFMTGPGDFPSDEENNRLAVCRAFESLFCSSGEIPALDAIISAFQASELALPQILKRAHFLHSKSSCPSFSSSGGDLLELNFGEKFHFHSSFLCPVTRETGQTKENPPALLPCGHLVSTIAIDRMMKNQRSGRRLKCPTCPREFSQGEARPVAL